MSSFVYKSETIPAGTHEFYIELYTEKSSTTRQVLTAFDGRRVFHGIYTTATGAQRAYNRELKKIKEEAKR